MVKCKILVLCKCNGRKNLTLGDNRETRQCSHFSKASKLKRIALSVSHLCKKILFAYETISNNLKYHESQSYLIDIIATC